MAWDSKRPVPWKRLFVEWAIVGAAMVLITVVLTRSPAGPTISAIVLGGGIYLAVGAVLAKFGYQRKSLAQLRAASAAEAQQKAARTAGSAPRPKPAPTRRTSTGPAQRPQGKRKR